MCYIEILEYRVLLNFDFAFICLMLKILFHNYLYLFYFKHTYDSIKYYHCQ